MTHITEAYASKLAVGRSLANLGARSVTITAVAKTRPTDSSMLYMQVNGCQSPSGQTPKDQLWFLKTIEQRQHAAFLLLVYAKYRAQFEPKPDAHGLAFSLAYSTYLRLTNSTYETALVSIERFNLLAGVGFQFGWRGILQGGSSKFASDNVKVLNCRKCGNPFLVEAHFMNYDCNNH